MPLNPFRNAAATVLLLALTFSGPASGQAALQGLTEDQMVAVQGISSYFSSITTMQADFIQTGPDGSQADGVVVIERPGLMRFQYAPPTELEIIADGRTVAINDKRLREQQLILLSQTPLRYLLDPNINLAQEAIVHEVRVEPDLITVVLEDTALYAQGRLTLYFDPRSYELKQWTVTDAQGYDTTVQVFNAQNGVATDPSWFQINYSLYRD
jgi:outer membrane lipoprotein-sorting protein